GFIHSGQNDPWEWGVPTGGPGHAASGTRVWATSLAGQPTNPVVASLVSPPLVLPRDSMPSLVFASWMTTGDCCYDFAQLSAKTIDETTWAQLDQFTGSSSDYEARSYSLAGFAGHTIQVRFEFQTDTYGTPAGWFLDDIGIRGLGHSVEFLPGSED